MATQEKSERSITSRESRIFLEKFLEKYDYLGPRLANHKKSRNTDDTYQFTMDRISKSFVDSLTRHTKVKDVYFHPVHPPQGYGISLRYKIYVFYNKVKKRVRRAPKK
jgi:hypothetical protein